MQLSEPETCARMAMQHRLPPPGCLCLLPCCHLQPGLACQAENIFNEKRSTRLGASHVYPQRLKGHELVAHLAAMCSGSAGWKKRQAFCVQAEAFDRITSAERADRLIWSWVKSQIARTPSDNPNPTTKISSKMGGEFTYQPKWDPKTVLTTTAISDPVSAGLSLLHTDCGSPSWAFCSTCCISRIS